MPLLVLVLLFGAGPSPGGGAAAAAAPPPPPPFGLLPSCFSGHVWSRGSLRCSPCQWVTGETGLLQ